MNKLSSSDRAALIKLASSLPKASPERKAVLAGLSKTASSQNTPFYKNLIKQLDLNYGPGVVEIYLGVGLTGGIRVEAHFDTELTIDEDMDVATLKASLERYFGVKFAMPKTEVAGLYVFEQAAPIKM